MICVCFCFPGRYAGLDTLGVERRPELVAVIALITNQVRCRGWQAFIHKLCAKMIAHLTFG